MDARMSAEERADVLSSMGIEAIPDEEDLPAHVPQELPQESDYLLLANRAIAMDVQVPAQSPSQRRKGQRADERKIAVMPRPIFKDRSLAAWRPSAAHKGSEKNAAFVEKN